MPSPKFLTLALFVGLIAFASAAPAPQPSAPSDPLGDTNGDGIPDYQCSPGPNGVPCTAEGVGGSNPPDLPPSSPHGPPANKPAPNPGQPPQQLPPENKPAQVPEPPPQHPPPADDPARDPAPPASKPAPKYVSPRLAPRSFQNTHRRS
ncbi:hypothetical protein ACLMJK_009460 [Lecanora helva]